MALPNGIVGNLFGPVEGRRHDSSILYASGLLAELERVAWVDQEPLCIYGDPAYPLSVYLQAPYRDVQLTDEMQMYNQSMSAVRTSVEWLFGLIKNYFKFVDFKKNLKIGLSAVGKTYCVSSILQNAHTCLYGNIVSEYFDLEPPSLQEYFR